MAIGDAAAAAGLTVFPDSQDLRLGSQNDNVRGDELAQVKTDLLSGDSAEAVLRASGDALKFDKAKIIISATTPAVVTGGIWFKPV